MRRTSASSVLFSTYNLLDMASVEDEHYAAVVAVIRSLEADVLAVQEVLAPDRETAAVRLRRLAADVGMHCDAPTAALAFGGHGYHVGLMWRDGIEPLPDSLRRHGGADFWHGLVQVTLDVGGTLVRHASFHATPFGRRLRTAQNERLVGAITGPAGAAPALIGADWNSECADRVQVDGAWRLFEPFDPYADVPWFGHLIHQCDWEYDDTGVRRHRADRSAGDVLWSGGLHDAAAALGAPCQPTAGHHPADVFGARGIRRRIDAIRVTAEVIPALRGHEVCVSSQAKAASDHLPVTVEYLPSTLDT
ncbi:MAG TPA: endonuclease/exonuclease/phosphatase family protein [Streptosporangiaceae bacterium]